MQTMKKKSVHFLQANTKEGQAVVDVALVVVAKVAVDDCYNNNGYPSTQVLNSI